MKAEDQDALEGAILAIDTSIRTLMMARQIIEDRLPGGMVAVRSSEPTLMGGESDEGCTHTITRDITTMGRTVRVCRNPECGAVLE